MNAFKPPTLNLASRDVIFHAAIEDAAEVRRLLEKIWLYLGGGPTTIELYFDAIADFRKSAAPARLIRRLDRVDEMVEEVETRQRTRSRRAAA
jgi:hypothetical protein